MPTQEVVTQNANIMNAEELDLLRAASESGREKFSIKQTLVPYLFIVQGASDYVKRGQPKFVDAAREGDIMDSMLLTPMASALVIPVKFEEHSTEWKPNEGGLVRQYFTDHSKYQAAARKSASDFEGMTRVTPEGNDITLVPTYTCLLVNPDTGRGRPVVLAMAGTQAKKSRQWNGIIDALEFSDGNGGFIPAPIYSQLFKLTTVPEHNKDGKTYAGWKVELVGLTLKTPTGRSLWQQAGDVRAQVERGELRMAPPGGEEAAEPAPQRTNGAGAATANAAGRAPADEEIPF